MTSWKKNTWVPRRQEWELGNAGASGEQASVCRGAGGGRAQQEGSGGAPGDAPGAACHRSWESHLEFQAQRRDLVCYHRVTLTSGDGDSAPQTGRQWGKVTLTRVG